MTKRPTKQHPAIAWLQKSWWFMRCVLLALSPTRFSFFVVLAVAGIFLILQQGTEILRGLAEPNADTGRPDFVRIVLFYASLIAWSFSSWYWARVLLNVQFPGVPAPPPGTGTRSIHWFRLHGPRILGLLPSIIVAIA